MLHAEGVTLELGSRPVLRELGADFEPATVALIHGPSGVGKTTFLRVLAGLERGASGLITCANEVWQSANQWLSPWQRRVGFVPQDLALWPDLTVAEHFSWALPRREGWNRATRGRRTRELLDELHLAHVERNRPSEMSGGEQQRLAIGRAIARIPRVLLLDEPTSHLDPELRQVVSKVILSLTHQNEVVTIWVEHDRVSDQQEPHTIRLEMTEGRLGKHITGRAY